LCVPNPIWQATS